MRHHSRQEFHSIFGVKVSNPRNGALIGYVGDVSEFGLKVFSELPFVKDERLLMYMQVREDEVMTFDLAATCKWSGNNLDTGYFEGGFCLEHPPAEFTSMVERMRGQHREIEKGYSPPITLSA